MMKKVPLWGFLPLAVTALHSVFLIYLLLSLQSSLSGSLLLVLPILLGITPRIWVVSHCNKRPMHLNQYRLPKIKHFLKLWFKMITFKNQGPP